jgi:hypothetical protein
MRVLVNGVMTAEESGSADVEALLVIDFFGSNKTGRVTGARSGDSGIEGMSESVAESDPWWSGLNEFARISGLKQARLSGHVGRIVYTPGRREKRK